LKPVWEALKVLFATIKKEGEAARQAEIKKDEAAKAEAAAKTAQASTPPKK